MPIEDDENKEVEETTESEETQDEVVEETDDLAEATDDDPTIDYATEDYHKLVMPRESYIDISRGLIRRRSELGPDEFDRSFKHLNSYEELTRRMIDALTDNNNIYKEALAKIDPKKTGDEYSYTPDEDADESDKPFTLKNRVMDVTKSLKGAEVTGKHARLLVLASNKNVKKVYLYNSGFYIILRGPDLVEINLIYNRLNEEMNEYGRMFGAVFYIYADFQIKQTCWEFIESLVIDSNLDKWDKGNRLRNAVSFLDYNPIIQSIGSLMFKNGYPFVHVCSGTEEKPCNHTMEETIDLSLFQLTDFSKVPQELLAQLSRNTIVKMNKVRAYQKKLNDSKPLTAGQYRIYRKVPTMTDYLAHGEEFNEELTRSIQDIKDEDIVEQYLRYNYSRLFAPWISYVESMSGDEVSFKIVEKDIISIVLNQIQSSEELDAFRISMNNYIQESMVTHIGYVAQPCESCGKLPSNAVNGFVPFDAQNSFFTMLVMRLIQAS